MRASNLIADLQTTLKHLPGQHNQDDHGSWARGRQLPLPGMNPPGSEFPKVFTTHGSQTADAVMVKWAEEKALLTHEEGLAIDDSGNVIFSVVGEKDVINLTDDQASQMRDAIFIHNHPGAALTFSGEDLLTFSQQEVLEGHVIGVDHNGQYNHYSVSAPEGDPDNWPATPYIAAALDSAHISGLYLYEVMTEDLGIDQYDAQELCASWENETIGNYFDMDYKAEGVRSKESFATEHWERLNAAFIERGYGPIPPADEFAIPFAFDPVDAVDQARMQSILSGAFTPFF